MKAFRSDRRFWFGVALLLLNASGWWWVKQKPAGAPLPKAADVQVAPAPAPGPVIKPLLLAGVEQVSLSPERQLTLALTFTGPVDWPSLASRLTLTADGKTVAWRFAGKERAAACQIRTESPVRADWADVRVEAGVGAASRDFAALAEPVAQRVAVVPEFSFVSLESFSPAFGQPYAVARFTQAAEARDAGALIESVPPVPLSVTPEPWDGGVRVTGPFVPGASYTLVFKAGLAARSGHRLEREVRRTVLFRHREPCVAIPAEGRYLAPEGDLLVPVLAVNTPHVESALARLLPQNLVQYVMREGGQYSGWWRDDPSSLAQELTARAVVRTNVLSAVRDQEQRLLLRLRDYGREPVRGVYVLEVSAPEAQPRSRLVCVTDLGLSARCDSESVEVWVTGLRTGRAAQGVRVELYGRNNLLWAQGVSDGQGLVRLPRRAEEGEPLLVLAQTADGSDLSMLQLTEGSAVEQRTDASRGYCGRGACEAFVMSDRDIYRHGERVFVQALLRQEDGRAPKPFPVTLHVVKPDGRTFKTYPLLPDARGAAFMEVTMPEYLPSGAYGLEVRLPGEGAVLGERRVLLEAFVPPQTRVKLAGLPASLRAGEELAFRVMAEHLFGKPAAGLAAEARVLFSDAAFQPGGAWEDFLFGDGEREKVSESVTCPRQVLDKDGTAAFSALAAVQGRPAARVRAQVQATVTETGGRTVSARAEAVVDPYPFYIGVAPGEGKLVRAGAPRTVTLAAVRPDGTRHAEQTALDVRVEKVAWISSLIKDPSGSYRWESERVKTEVAQGRAETGPANTAHTFAVEGTGDYVITFTDPVSHASASWAFSAGEEGQTAGEWSRESPERVELVFDKEAYRPGETARLQIRAPHAGQAWVSLLGERLLESRVLTLTNNTATLEWAVTEAFAPNVGVAVSVVRPAAAERVWGAHRASGEALLRVLPPARKLAVRVRPDAEVWRPKSQGTVRVTVSGADGRPASGASVTVLAVDEGVCLLTDYGTPDPYGFFSEPRWAGLPFYDVYGSLMPITDERLLGSASHVGGDGGDEMLKRLNPVAARRFKPLAMWRSDVRTDAAGEAEVAFDLPEFAGELRLMAVAWDERATGSGEASVKVKRKLVVEPDLPRFLAPGDRAAVLVALHNESGADCSARLSVRAEGPLASDGGVREVPLKAGESAALQVPVQALARAGAGRVIVSVEGAGERYEEPIELAVRPAAALRVADECAVLKPGEERAFGSPEGALEGSVRQTFFCSAQPSVDLLGALEYVMRYPYGCLEQTVSAALPLLALSGLESRLPAQENTLALEAPERIRAALLRVLSMRRWSGFAMWPDASEVSPQASIYAALFLVQAEQAGYALPAGVSGETVRMLHDRLSESEESRAYACHVLALAGRPEHAWMLRLYEQRESLKPEARFHLARALIRSGEVEKGREVLALSKSVQGMREAAFALLARLEIDPADPAVAACCREIDRARRREGHWGSTQDNALALLALGAYLRAVPEQPGTFSPAWRWEGGSHGVAATNACVWVPPAEAGRGTVYLRNAGPGPLHVARRVSHVPSEARDEMADSGLVVRRQWLGADGAPVDPAKLKRGDLVIVSLTLDTLGRPLQDVVVEELLPAGLEIESARLERSCAQPWLQADEAGWVLHREARDDRLLLFSKRISGTCAFHYAARAVSPGEFVVPPIAASAMYDPDTFSRWGLGRVTVK